MKLTDLTGPQRIRLDRLELEEPDTRVVGWEIDRLMNLCPVVMIPGRVNHQRVNADGRIARARS